MSASPHPAGSPPPRGRALPGDAVDVAASDVEATSRDATVAQWSVAVVVMAGSAVAAWFTFTHLGEFGGVGVVTALGVDAALVAWLRISRRLRGVGITSVPGHVLEIVAGLMTLYLNVGAAAFRGVDERTAQYLLAFAHTFMPIIMVVLGFAGADAQLKLRALRNRAVAVEKEQRDAEAQRQQSIRAAEQAAIAAERERDNDRRVRENQAGLRLKELDAERHEREMAERRQEREHRDRHLAAALSSVVFLSLSPLVGRPRRRPRSPGVRQPGSLGIRQGGSPASPAHPHRPEQQDNSDVAGLASLAKVVLERRPGLGRTGLANELGITTYRARVVLEHLEAERREAQDAELEQLLKGGLT